MRQKIEKKMRNKWKWKGHFDRISSSSVLTMTSPFSKCRIFSNFPITLCRFFYFVCCCVLSRRRGSPQTNHHIYHCEKNSRSYRRRREYTKHGVLHARRRGNRVWWQRSAQCIHTDIHIRGMRMCVHSAVWSEAHMLYYVIYALPVWCTHASNNCWPSARTKQKIIKWCRTLHRITFVHVSDQFKWYTSFARKIMHWFSQLPTEINSTLFTSIFFPLWLWWNG